MGLAVNDERLTLRVGGVVLLVVAIAAVAVVLLDGYHFRSGAHVQVYFRHTGSLQEGGDFQVAGKVIGEVESIRLVPPRRAADPEHPLHPDGGVVCDVRIEKRYLEMTLDNGEVFVSSKGIVGKGYLEQGAPPHGVAPGEPLSDGDSIRGIDPPQMDRVMMRSYQNLLASKYFLSAVQPEARRFMRELRALLETVETLEPHDGALADLADATAAFSRDLDRVSTKWASGDVDLADLERLATRGRATLTRARTAVAEIETHIEALETDLRRLQQLSPSRMRAKLDQAIAQGRDSLDKLEKIRTTVTMMLALVEAGEGTIGGLLNDPEFADNAKQIGKILKRQPWKIFGTQRGQDPP